MEIRPVDLPLLRDETVEFVRANGQTIYSHAIGAGRQQMRPVGSPLRGAEILSGAEVQRLRDAELFFVTGPMTDLTVAAGAGLPKFNLMPEDLPSREGLIFFEKPIATVDYGQWYADENQSPIVAASWSHWTGGNTAWVHGGIWVTWYADREGMIRSALDRGLLDTRAAARIRAEMGRLVIDNETQCCFSPDQINVVETDGDRPVQDSGTIAQWLTVLKSAWLLMGQTIAKVEDATYHRAARRRLEKQGKEPPRVRVITLRRQASTGGSAESDREWHHQWVVRGHWRQQWLPSRGVHRPTWISPHIKGPEGAPMLGGEKVYALQR